MSHDVTSTEVGGVQHTDIQDCISFRNVCIVYMCVLGKPVCTGVTQHPCLCRFLCVWQEVGVTYCDDIQDAEQAVDAVSWVNLLHHTFFAILEDRNKTCI